MKYIQSAFIFTLVKRLCPWGEKKLQRMILRRNMRRFREQLRAAANSKVPHPIFWNKSVVLSQFAQIWCAKLSARILLPLEVSDLTPILHVVPNHVKQLIDMFNCSFANKQPFAMKFNNGVSIMIMMRFTPIKCENGSYKMLVTFWRLNTKNFSSVTYSFVLEKTNEYNYGIQLVFPGELTPLVQFFYTSELIIKLHLFNEEKFCVRNLTWYYQPDNVKKTVGIKSF
jgi:hypothetical protein